MHKHNWANYQAWVEQTASAFKNIFNNFNYNECFSQPEIYMYRGTNTIYPIFNSLNIPSLINFKSNREINCIAITNAIKNVHCNKIIFM